MFGLFREKRCSEPEEKKEAIKLTDQEKRFIERTKDERSRLQYLNNPEYLRKTIELMIGLGERWLIENPSMAKAYFERAGLSTEEIEAKFNSPEFKIEAEIKAADQMITKEVAAIEGLIQKLETEEDVRGFYEHMAEEALKKRPENFLPKETAEFTVNEAMRWLMCVGYSFEQVRQWLLEQNEKLFKSKPDKSRADENCYNAIQGAIKALKPESHPKN